MQDSGLLHIRGRCFFDSQEFFRDYKDDLMKRIFFLLCLLPCLIGCDSPQGGLVTEQSEMTLEELQAMQAASIAAETAATEGNQE